MGRWAQRQRGGGGAPPSPLPQIKIDEGVNQGGHLADFVFSSEVNALSYNAADFISLPNGGAGSSIAQTNVATFEVTFPGSTDADTNWKYIGHAPNQLTPQAGDYV